MEDCIFCKIIAGEAPADLVYADDNLVAFMDIFPASHGHLLIVPRVHTRNLYDTPPELAAQAMALAAHLAPALRDATGADGMNIWQSSERPAGQVVFHFHMHMLPRYRNDGIPVPGNRSRADAVELSALAAAIRANLDD
jgi:histidine triad (HIT) family protein